MADETHISKISLRFDPLEVSEGELNLDLTLYALTAKWGIARGGGSVKRSLEPNIPATSVQRASGIYMILDGGSIHLHLTALAVESGSGHTSPFSASGGLAKNWGGRGTFSYAGFDVGPCAVTREK